MVAFAALILRDRAWMTRLALLCALLPGMSACSSSSPPTLIDMLPADNEVGTWTRVGDAQLLTEVTALYNRIDGAAPKYIDRGWVGSVYANYSDGTQTIQVAIHDMGSAANAQDIYNAYLPASLQAVPGRDSAVVDMGLPTAYAAHAYRDRFYIELNIDQKSDAALTAIQQFVNQILDRARS